MHRVEVQLEDDLTGGPADETVQFGVDGRAYEIDLTARHAADFRRRLEPFIDSARLAHARRSTGTVRTAASRERSRQIRAWAMDQGLELSPHGRLPRDVVLQYDAHHGDAQPAPRQPARQPAARTSARRATGSGTRRRTSSTRSRSTSRTSSRRSSQSARLRLSGCLLAAA